jgi:hypothetical protein
VSGVPTGRSVLRLAGYSVLRLAGYLLGAGSEGWIGPGHGFGDRRAIFGGWRFCGA